MHHVSAARISTVPMVLEVKCCFSHAVDQSSRYVSLEAAASDLVIDGYG